MEQTPIPILVWMGAAGSRELADRLARLGFEPVEVDTQPEALLALEAPGREIAAALLPVEIAEEHVRKVMKSLRRCRSGKGFHALVYGHPAERAARKRLRSAGVQLALWEPYDEGTLRFQVHRTVHGDGEEHGRIDRRVPTYLMARVVIGERERDVIVYTLSPGGAFLETPRACMEGAKVEIQIRFPGHPIDLSAEVLYSNVPGNLKRPNLPIGMGVRFLEPGHEAIERVRHYVDERWLHLEV